MGRLTLEQKREKLKRQLEETKKEYRALRRKELEEKRIAEYRLECRKALIIWRKIQRNAAENRQSKAYLDRLLESIEDPEERVLFGLAVIEEKAEETAETPPLATEDLPFPT